MHECVYAHVPGTQCFFQNVIILNDGYNGCKYECGKKIKERCTMVR